MTMNVYHLTMSEHFNVDDYKSSDIFELLHVPGVLFASLAGAQRAAQKEADSYVEFMSDLEVPVTAKIKPQVTWEQISENLWTGTLPETDDEQWLAIVHRVEVQEDETPLNLATIPDHFLLSEARLLFSLQPEVLALAANGTQTRPRFTWVTGEHAECPDDLTMERFRYLVREGSARLELVVTYADGRVEHRNVAVTRTA